MLARFAYFRCKITLSASTQELIITYNYGALLTKYTTVSIPRGLRSRIEAVIAGSGFKSVSDYVTYVLREVVSMHESEKLSNPFGKEEVEMIRERLKALGYI